MKNDDLFKTAVYELRSEVKLYFSTTFCSNCINEGCSLLKNPCHKCLVKLSEFKQRGEN